MNELSLLDYLVLKLRFWRKPPEGVPTLSEVWREEGSADPVIQSPEEAPPSGRRRPRWPRIAPGDGPAPLGVCSALALAFVGQTMLTGGEPAVAVVLIAGAMGAAFFAFRRGEITFVAPSDEEPSEVPGSRPRPILGAAAVVATVIAGVLASENRAGPILLLVWIAAVLLAVTALATRRGAGLPFGRDRWPAVSGWAIAAVVFFLAAGVVVRTVGLATVPSEMTSIHAELIQAIHSAAHGDLKIVFPSSSGGFWPIPVYLGVLLAPLAGGLSFAGLKLGTLLAGLITLVVVYLLGREIGGRTTGFCALALATVGQWPDLVSRLGFTGGWYPPIAAAALLFLLRGIRRGHRGDFVAAGVMIGLGLQTHPMARSLIPLAVVLIALAMIPAGSARRRRLAVGLGSVLVLAVITGLPTIVAAPEPPPAAGELWWLGAADGDRDGKVFDGLLERAGRTVLLPLWSDGSAWFHGGGNRPALDRVAASLLVLGFAVAVIAALGRRRSDALLLLVAVPLLMLPAILSPAQPGMAPSPLRCGGAIAPVFVLAGIGLGALFRSITSSLSAPAGRRVAAVAAAVLVVVSTVAGRTVVQGPFADSWDRSTWNASELGEVVRSAVALGVEPEHARVIPYPHWVDTRLVAVEAGLPGRDLALDPTNLEAEARWPGPALYLLHPDDTKSLETLIERLPRATTTRHPSRVEGKLFLSVTVLMSRDGG